MGSYSLLGLTLYHTAGGHACHPSIFDIELVAIVAGHACCS